MSINPVDLFRDKNYSSDIPKISDKDLELLKNGRENYNQIPQPIVKNFEDINNPKTFQIQSISNEIQILKTKILELEKKMASITGNTHHNPPVQVSQNPLMSNMPQNNMPQNMPKQSYNQPVQMSQMPQNQFSQMPMNNMQQMSQLPTSNNQRFQPFRN